MNEEDMINVADYIDNCIKLALEIQNNTGKSLKMFCDALENNKDIEILKKDIVNFANKFSLYEDS